MDKLKEKVLLSMPHMSGGEMAFIEDAFQTNWVAPLGPNVSGFEKDLQDYIGVEKAVAMSSGTAAIHIALELLGVGAEDQVFVSSLTFIASVNPILYQAAIPVFIDSEPDTWNMSPQALARALKKMAALGKLPKAVIAVDLFGMPANYQALEKICNEFEVPLVTDAAESLGASFFGKKCGSFGKFGILSFNGNKIITTGGGGVLLSDDKKLMEKALFLITQARDPAPFYQHSHVGYNYRMSNILAGVGRGQMKVLEDRVRRRREIYQLYADSLSGVGLNFYKEPENYFSNRWLSTACLGGNDKRGGLELSQFLNEKNIESRPVWKPMHLQPLFKGCRYFVHEEGAPGVSDHLFQKGICLPSASNYDNAVYKQVIEVIKFWLQH